MVKRKYLFEKNDLDCEFVEDDRTSVPSTWSSSMFNICTVPINPSAYRTLECYQMFEQSMSRSHWEIDQVKFFSMEMMIFHSSC